MGGGEGCSDCGGMLNSLGKQGFRSQLLGLAWPGRRQVWGCPSALVVLREAEWWQEQPQAGLVIEDLL